MEIDIKIDKTNLTATVSVELVPSIPVYEHERTGRVVDYKNGEVIKESTAREMVEIKLASEFAVTNKISGPTRLDNYNCEPPKEGRWVFGIKSLTKTPKSGKVNKTVQKITKKKTKKSSAAPTQTS